MVTNAKWMGRWIVIAVAIGLFCPAVMRADKPVKPPKPGDEVAFTYELIDLLGFPDSGYQSQGEFITNRDAVGDILIGGNSRLYPDPEGPAVFHPAIWHVDILGNFPATDPVDLGLPDFAGEAGVYGLNSSGVMVADTKRAVVKDENDNWLFPAYVDHPVWGVIELPSPIARRTSVSGINDSGVIVGTYVDYDPDDPDAVRGYSGIWQLNSSDGTIDGPASLGEFYPRDINNFGVMAGRCPGWPAIAWFEEETLVIVQLDSSLRFWGADPNALNDYPAGDDRLTVVGVSRFDENGDPTFGRGYAWRPWNSGNSTTLLGTLGGASSCSRRRQPIGGNRRLVRYEEAWPTGIRFQGRPDVEPEFDGRHGAQRFEIRPGD